MRYFLKYIKIYILIFFKYNLGEVVLKTLDPTIQTIKIPKTG